MSSGDLNKHAEGSFPIEYSSVTRKIWIRKVKVITIDQHDRFLGSIRFRAHIVPELGGCGHAVEARLYYQEDMGFESL